MISNCGHDEKGNYHGGAAGDQTGTEWQIRSWYNRPWDVILRFPDEKIGQMIANEAIDAANNNKIGYDQWNRLSFWNELKKVGYKTAAVANNCETDCSAGVAAIVKAVGYQTGNEKLKAVPENAWTGSLRAALTTAGFQAMTFSKYLTTEANLKPGDILLNEKHHVAIEVGNGKKKEQTNTTGGTCIVELTELKKGTKGSQVKTAQILLKHYGYKGADKKVLTIDGSFGANTENAVRAFQKGSGLVTDGVIRTKTWSKLLRP